MHSSRLYAQEQAWQAQGKEAAGACGTSVGSLTNLSLSKIGAVIMTAIETRVNGVEFVFAWLHVHYSPRGSIIAFGGTAHLLGRQSI